MESILKNFDLVPEDARMILVGALLFVALWQLLSWSLFGPYIRLMEARDAATLGAQSTARQNIAQAELSERNYQEQFNVARVEFLRVRNEAIDRTRVKATEIVALADREMRQVLELSRNEINRDLQEVSRDAEEQAKQLGQAMSDHARGLMERS